MNIEWLNRTDNSTKPRFQGDYFIFYGNHSNELNNSRLKILNNDVFGEHWMIKQNR